VEIPSSLDWRKKGKVPPVKYQGQCGSTWAFTVTDFIESQWLIKKEKLKLFSTQQLIDFDDENKNVPIPCTGGFNRNYLKYKEKYGIESEEKYPMTPYGGKCEYKSEFVEANVSDINYTQEIDKDLLKKYLNEIGPLALLVDASDFQMYTSGILKCKTN